MICMAPFYKYLLGGFEPDLNHTQSEEMICMAPFYKYLGHTIFKEKVSWLFLCILGIDSAGTPRFLGNVFYISDI